MRQLFFVIFSLIASSCFSDVVLTGGLTDERNLSAGLKVEGTIPMLNTGNKEASVRVTHVDYNHNSEGENFFDPPGSHSRSNTSWITMSSSSVITIAPNSTHDFSYSIQTPSDINISGTYWSLFLIEPLDNANAHGVQGIVVRYGVQVITHIGDMGHSELKIVKNNLIKQVDKTILCIDGQNVGSMMVKPIMFVDIFDIEGKKMGHFAGPKDRLLPNCSNRYQFDISSIPPGKYKAVALFDAENSITGSRFDLDVI